MKTPRIHRPITPKWMQPYTVGTYRFLQRVSLGLRSRVARIHPHPIFVLGNQKSGTTAIAALLATASDSSVMLDIFHRFRQPLLKQLLTGQMSMSDLVRRKRICFSTKIIKEPNLTFFYDQLVECFPDAQYVFVVRDPRDNIRSILNRLQIPGNLKTLDARYVDSLPPDSAWRLILSGDLFGTAGHTYIETLANRWESVAGLAYVARQSMTIIRYEDFDRDKKGAIERLAETLGLDVVRDVGDAVHVQYQPRGDRNVSWQDFFGTDNLRTIEQNCRDGMNRFHYTAT